MAQIDLLTVHFSGPGADALLVRVDPGAYTISPEVAAAVLEYFVKPEIRAS
jgi:hypothetical protein